MVFFFFFLFLFVFFNDTATTEIYTLSLHDVFRSKVNPDELKCLTSASDIDGVKILQKKGIDSVILTDKQNISLLSKNRIYSITLPNLELVDTTGIGDIF